MHVALGCTLEENLDGVREKHCEAKRRGFEPALDCEHFFDGYKAIRIRDRRRPRGA